MDWVPLLVGSAVGAGNSAVGHYLSATSLAGHKYLLYRAAVFGVGFWGEWSGHLNPDTAYSLMTASASLIAQDIPAAVSGAGLGAFGAVAAAPPTPQRVVIATAAPPEPAWNRKVAIVPNTQPATAAG